MSKGQKLRALVNERLTAAAAEIFELFERTIAEYEQEVLRFKQTNDTQQQLLAAVLEPTLHSHTTGVQTVTVSQKVVGTSLESPHIKEEPELCIKQEDGQLQEFPFFPVCVKTEADEDKSSVLHQRATEENREETNGEDCGAEAGCSSDPLTQLHSDSEEHTADHSEDWTLHWEPQAHTSTTAGPDHSSEPLTQSHTDSEEHTTDHSEDYSQEQTSQKGSYAMIQSDLVVKPHRCPECGKRFLRKDHLQGHMIIHTGERPHKCSFCEKTFIRLNHLKTHLRNHTGERPFSCSFCNRGFTTKALLIPHMRIHTGDRPFKCSECDKGFRQKSHLRTHVKTHTREKTFSCLICKQIFSARGDLMVHSRRFHPE